MSTASSPTVAASQPAFVAKNWRDLIRPRNLDVDTESLTDTYGKFTCEPLERGFGTTPSATGFGGAALVSTGRRHHGLSR